MKNDESCGFVGDLSSPSKSITLCSIPLAILVIGVSDGLFSKGFCSLTAAFSRKKKTEETIVKMEN